SLRPVWAWSVPPDLLPAPLLPKLRAHFTEFLLRKSLEHLRLLASPTCIGLRYGHSTAYTRGFSWQSAHDSRCGGVRPLRHPLSTLRGLYPPETSTAV